MSGAKCPRLAIGPQPCRVERFVCRPQRWRCVAQGTVKSRTMKNREPWRHSRRGTRTRSCRLADKFVSCADGAMRVRDAIARASAGDGCARSSACRVLGRVECGVGWTSLAVGPAASVRVSPGPLRGLRDHRRYPAYRRGGRRVKGRRPAFAGQGASGECGYVSPWLARALVHYCRIVAYFCNLAGSAQLAGRFLPIPASAGIPREPRDIKTFV